ncbi:MAG: hypothetical protein HY296_05580 [Thaumarchaeota archaeon]|nr:hypothetical protein [Nitrososphaerota archaeon]
MSGDIVDKPFREAEDQVESAHKQAVAELKAKVRKAKEEALKKVGS